MTADAVCARDVFCLYPTPRGHVAALRGLTVEVAAGERVVVHGPNGSGKTTLLRVLIGELAPSAGTVDVCGVDLVGAADSARTRLRRHHIGLIDQHHGRTLRPEISVLDNVALQLRLAGVGRRAARRQARALLDSLGLGGLATRRPVTLSGGEAQRVAVCAAVAHAPRLILADEPTGELDPRSAEAVYDLLAQAAARTGAALLVVSHDTRAARIADRIVRIRDGRLSEEWTPNGTESLVVDDRGWVRLPEGLRRHTGLAARVHATADGPSIVLTPGPAAPDVVASDVVASDVAASNVVASNVLTPDGVAARVVAPRVVAPRVMAPREAAVLVGAGGGEGGTTGATGEGESPGESGSANGGAGRYGRGEALAVGRGIEVARDGRTVLHGLDVDLWPGTLTVVHGRSGSGKTTLLRVLSGLERPDAGVVRVGGTDLAGLDRSGLAALRRRYVAVSGQSTALLDGMDADENLELVRIARGVPAPAAGAVDWIAALGLVAVRARPVRVLSGGERQRVAVARVMASQPQMAILDEPTSRQDEAHAELVVAALVTAARHGIAVVAATHDPVLTAAADTVIDLAALAPPS